MPNRADIAVIGGGPGGYTAAIRAAQRGASVVLFERDRLGGVCLNRGCIPSKALLESARRLEQARTSGEHGLRGTENASLDWPAAHARKRAVVERLRKGVAFLLNRNKIVLKTGTARLETAGRVTLRGEAEVETWEAGGVIVATGSRPAVIPGLEPDGETVLGSDDILALESIPASVAVVGGGAIGCEWATLFACGGSRVELVEIMDQLLPGADADVAREIQRGFKKRGIKLHLKTKVASLDRAAGGATLVLSSGKTIRADRVLVSVGRRPAGAEALAEGCGVRIEDGRIPVDVGTRTNVEGVHAIGDVTGEVMLAHYASHQGVVAAENLTGGDLVTNPEAVPACVFCEPEAGWVGRTRAEAEAAGLAVSEGSFPFRALGRAWAAGEVGGLVKVVAEKASGRVLGVHAVGPRATDLVAEGTLAVRHGITAAGLEETIRAHPTFPEAVGEAAGDVMGLAIHK